MGLLDRLPLPTRLARRGDEDEDEDDMESRGGPAGNAAETDDSGPEDAERAGGGFLGRIRNRLRRSNADDLEFEEDSGDDDFPVGSLAGGVVAAQAAAPAGDPLQGVAAVPPEALAQGPVAVYLTGDPPEDGAASAPPPTAEVPEEDGGDSPESSSGDLSQSLKDIFTDDAEEDTILKDLADSVENVSAADLAADLQRFLEEQVSQWR